MPLTEHIYSVLAVSASEKFAEGMLSLLPESTYSPVHRASSINEAQRKFLERPYDIVLINTPLPDDFGIRFALDASASKTSVVLLFIRNEIYSDVYQKVCDYGVFTMRKPAAPQTISLALDWLKTTNERLRRMEKKSMTLQEKMEEIKLVNRAKWTLINSRNMTEAEAHRYIEKQAMDKCVTKREIAESIINRYK